MNRDLHRIVTFAVKGKIKKLHQELATEVQRYGDDFSDLIIRMVAEDYHTTAAEVLEVWMQSEADAKDRDGGAC